MSTAPTHPSHGWLRPRRGPDEHRVTDFGRLLVGLIVLALGVLFLLDAAGVLNAGRVIDDWWPSVFVAAGLLTLLERPPAVVRGLVLVGIGALLLLFTTDVLHGNAWAYVWPALVILAGLAILAHWAGRTIPAGARDEDVVRSTAVFGGHKLPVTARNFQGAWLTAIFGGIELDLRDATPAPGGASVNATVVFGGTEILVPRGWRINVRCTPIFGGLDDKTDHKQALPDDAPVLNVDAVALFGGVDVKHEK